MVSSTYDCVVGPRIVVHFHPGWGFGEATVLYAIAATGVYRSQWETGTSNGGLTARLGGDRWESESRIFDGRYDNADAADRPVYGSWNRRDDPFGASPRFGSAYLRLRSEVTARATFCWPGSVYGPAALGGPERLDELCRLADRGVLVRSELPDPAADLPLEDPLNDYVEAQVHGGLSIVRDVEALVLDPTDREAHVEVIDRLGCPVLTHPGYRVTADAIDPDRLPRPGLGRAGARAGRRHHSGQAGSCVEIEEPRCAGGQVAVALPGTVRPARMTIVQPVNKQPRRH